MMAQGGGDKQMNPMAMMGSLPKGFCGLICCESSRF